MHFDPVVVLNHFVALGVAEPSTMGGAKQGRGLDKRILCRITLFVQTSTSEKKCLAEAKKRLTHIIRLANDLRFAGTTKTTISLFPFFGATFFFPRDIVGFDKNLSVEPLRRSDEKNQMHFDSVVVLNHFVAQGVAEPSTMGGREEA
ncbi:Ribosomal protein [Vigna angularis]|uniref:Ribosomal protein n=1 Tax=Phaseolus angularis TaxID=3914 RepID=A0A8T0K1L0_PHAAN|nr:Ribosomal protein [Vigna angularis]